MNKKFKTISAALLAAAMCASFAGCSKKNDTGVYVDKNGNVSVNESKFENHVNSVLGGGTKTSASSSEPEEIKFVISEEIKTAKFESGLIQLNNDIFQMGGYLTVADFVKKYKDKYDIVYMNANLPYEEAVKEYLLQSYDYVGEWKYNLSLTPKDGVGDSSDKLYVQIENRTTSGGEDKIPLSEGIVTEFCIDGQTSHETTCPCWYPQGFTPQSYKYKDLETANTDYKRDTFIKMLEGKGFTLFEGNHFWTKEDLNNRYWKSGNDYEFQVTGEVNCFGKKPVYRYVVFFNSDTDKLSSVSFRLEKYVD